MLIGFCGIPQCVATIEPIVQFVYFVGLNCLISFASNSLKLKLLIAALEAA